MFEDDGSTDAGSVMSGDSNLNLDSDQLSGSPSPIRSLVGGTKRQASNHPPGAASKKRKVARGTGGRRVPR